MYVEVGSLIFTLLVLYCFMRTHLKVLNNLTLGDDGTLIRSRNRFLRTVAGGLSSYLGAPMVAWVPAHLNWISTAFGLFAVLFLNVFVFLFIFVYFAKLRKSSTDIHTDTDTHDRLKNICKNATIIGLESQAHVVSWYVLSALLLGFLHGGIFIVGISLVRQSWNTWCNPKNARVRSQIHQRYIFCVCVCVCLFLTVFCYLYSMQTLHATHKSTRDYMELV